MKINRASPWTTAWALIAVNGTVFAILFMYYRQITIICLIRALGTLSRSDLINCRKSWGSEFFNGGFGQLLKNHCQFWPFMMTFGSPKLKGVPLIGTKRYCMNRTKVRSTGSFIMTIDVLFPGTWRFSPHNANITTMGSPPNTSVSEPSLPPHPRSPPSPLPPPPSPCTMLTLHQWARLKIG